MLTNDLLAQEDALRSAQVDRNIYAAKEFNRHLQELDSRLELVWVSPMANAPGIIPGRWHIVRHNDGIPDTYFPIHAPDGSYQEPHSGVIERLRRQDLWSAEGQRRWHEDSARRQRQAQEAAEKAREERREQIAERVESSQRLSVRFPGEHKRA